MKSIWPWEILNCSSLRQYEIDQNVTQFICMQGELTENTFIFSSYFIYVFKQQSVWSKFESFINHFLRNISSKCCIPQIFCSWIIAASDGYKLLLQKETEYFLYQSIFDSVKFNSRRTDLKYFLLVSIQSFLSIFMKQNQKIHSTYANNPTGLY